MKVRRTRSISARCSLRSSSYRLALSSASARTLSAVSSAPFSRSARASRAAALPARVCRSPAGGRRGRGGAALADFASIEGTSPAAARRSPAFLSATARAPSSIRPSSAGTRRPARGGSRGSPRARSGSSASPLEPGGEARMELGARLLRQRGVGDVPDQHVVEPEAVVARVERAVGAQRTPCARARAACPPRPGARRPESSPTAPRWKRRPSTAARCSDGPLAAAQPVDAGGEKGLDRGGTASAAASGSSVSIASICSTKSGLPSAVCTILRAQRRAAAASPPRPVDQAFGVGAAEWLQRDEARARRGASRTGASRRGLDA